MPASLRIERYDNVVMNARARPFRLRKRQERYRSQAPDRLGFSADTQKSPVSTFENPATRDRGPLTGF